jgi:hypothetical protein
VIFVFIGFVYSDEAAKIEAFCLMPAYFSPIPPKAGKGVSTIFEKPGPDCNIQIMKVVGSPARPISPQAAKSLQKMSQQRQVCFI